MVTIQKSESLTSNKTWGRASEVSLPTLLGCLFLFIATPLLVYYFYISAFFFNCSLIAPLQVIMHDTSSFLALIPYPTFTAGTLFLIWFGLQIGLALLPDYIHHFVKFYHGGNTFGAVTPAGHQLKYNINGLQAWVISLVLFSLASFGMNWISPTIIFDHWGALLGIVMILGFALGIFVFIKAYLFPTHPDDRKFSGNMFYDFFMGIELNPRIGKLDLKLFFNGRPGIVAWSLINLSFLSEQYVRYGHVTNSMILVNLFQGLYVLYFFWKEAWYLKTIDIHHDHFGWMLTWGDCTALPYLYTLQALFLVFHPIELSPLYAFFVLAIGLTGFYIFTSANNQKYNFRRQDGEILIWGYKPESITCSYMTKDGNRRETKLLTSGWWGMARHMNYTGDLILSLAYSLACGVTFLFPYFYIIFLTGLLIHRCIRDEERCGHKYGKQWDQYCSKVPYRLIPYIW